MDNYKYLARKAITEQQQVFSAGSLQYAVGEILKEISEESQTAAELIFQDLEKDTMNLDALCKHITGIAKKAAQNGTYAMSNDEVNKILREFYAIPAKTERPKRGPIDITELL